MAELEYSPVKNTDQTHTVTRSTGTSVLGSAAAVIIIDNALTKAEVFDAVRAAWRALRRDSGKGTAPADFPTTGTSLE